MNVNLTRSKMTIAISKYTSILAKLNSSNEVRMLSHSVEAVYEVKIEQIHHLFRTHATQLRTLKCSKNVPNCFFSLGIKQIETHFGSTSFIGPKNNIFPHQGVRKSKNTIKDIEFCEFRKSFAFMAICYFEV